MDSSKQNEPAENKKTTAAPAAKKTGPVKLPSKPISFSNHPTAKGGKQAKATVNKGKKGGVNLMRKLSGM
jgi:hypothetical protein